MGDVDIAVMFVLLFLCGWFQGMGWRRVVVLWCTGGRRKNVAALCSVELCAQRRWWYSAAAVPAGMAWFNDWHAALYMPAFCAIRWHYSPLR